MIRTPVVTAEVIGTPDIPLTLTDGSITFDTGRSPHVIADLRIGFPDDATLDALDPRNDARVRIIADSIKPATTEHREFDLMVRGLHSLDTDPGLRVVLASDESGMEDYKPLTDDTTPRSLEGSLRSIINYVLGEVYPGAVLEATPAHDADMTAYWPLTNLVTNPSGYPGTQGYSAGGNCSAVESRTAGYVGTTSVRWRSAGAGGSYLKAAPVAVEDGSQYFMSARIINTSGRNLRIGMWFYDPAGGLISTYESDAMVATGGYDLLETFITPPPGTDSAVPFALFGALGSNETAALDALMLVQADEAVEYFQPGVSVAGYTTAWESGGGGEGYAQATRTPDIERDPESTIWRAGTSAMAFLMPLVQASGLRLVCDEARQWTLRDASYIAAGSLDVRQSVNAHALESLISRDSEDWFTGAVAIYEWTDRRGVKQRRVDSYALPGATMRRTFEFDTPYPGPGFAQYAVERAQGRGREVTATLPANWHARAEQSVTVRPDVGPVQLGTTQRVVFDIGTDEVTVTQRPTDVAPGAVALLSGTVNDLTGTVNDL